MIRKIALGTVQLAVDYGVNNKEGVPSFEQVVKLLDRCKDEGIDLLDTAPAYGDGERILGQYLRTNDGFRIISKTPPEIQPRNLRLACEESLRYLQIEKLYAYIVHHYSAYSGNRKMWDEMLRLKHEGLVEKIGFSLYSPTELFDMFEHDVLPDIISIPYSLFDRRFEELLPKLVESNIEIHARSVFLQGMFFMAPDKVRQQFGNEAGEKIARLRNICDSNDISIGTACLNYVVSNDSIDRVTIGVETEIQLLNNIESLKYVDKVTTLMDQFEEIRMEDENILLPYKWNN